MSLWVWTGAAAPPQVTMPDSLASFPSSLEMQSHWGGVSLASSSGRGRGGPIARPLPTPRATQQSPAAEWSQPPIKMHFRVGGGRDLALLSRRGLPHPTRHPRRGPRSPGLSPTRYRVWGRGLPRPAAPPLTGLSSAPPNGSLVSGGSTDQHQSSGPHGLRSGSPVPHRRSAARSDDRGRHFVSGGCGVVKLFIQLYEPDSSPRGPLVIQGSCGAVACGQPRFLSADQRN
ncbi:hypothetical protein NDU88_006816 [Pleurodeles waltl]|uniref:Uncharacterized protein n=1 Tax=Pleurodeles waltl TaxID=8319 RepID=A0AAV7QN16_PLEWA|nr:hypothetical protein NDU88_006816 [Pleurodeles waltl]